MSGRIDRQRTITHTSVTHKLIKTGIGVNCNGRSGFIKYAKML